MPVFRYKGFDSQGKPVSGIKDADSDRSLRALLRKDGIMLTEIKLNQAQVQTQSSGKTVALSWQERFQKSFNFGGKASTQTIAILTRQLATLLKAGVQLSESMAALVDQAEKPAMKQVLSDVKIQVNEGRSFSQALARHPGYFSDLYVNMVAVGEAAGNLDSILFRLAEFLDNQNKLKSKVTSALIYPAIMTVMGLIVMIILMTTIVPKVTEVYADAGQSLPWNTLLLIGLTDILFNYFWLLIPGIFLTIFAFTKWKKSKSGRAIWDRLQLRMWGVGNLTRMLAISRFASTASAMLAAGLPLLKALEIVENVLGNSILMKAVAKARESIREGESISQPLKRSGEFPTLVCHMIAVGERSGQLETMLENVASAYGVEVETKVSRLTALLEPLMIIFMGLGVAFVVFSVMMPILNMSNTVQ